MPFTAFLRKKSLQPESQCANSFSSLGDGQCALLRVADTGNLIEPDSVNLYDMLHARWAEVLLQDTVTFFVI